MNEIDPIFSCTDEDFAQVAQDIIDNMGGLFYTAIRSGPNLQGQREDMVQELSLNTFELLLQIRRGEATLPSRVGWATFWLGKASNWLRSYSDSSAVQGLSGVGGYSRRVRSLYQYQSELTTKLEREPTGKELVDYANMRARQTRSNPSKQGMVFTEADLDDLRTVLSFDGGFSFDPPEVEAQGVDRFTAREVIEAARRDSPWMHLIAEAFLGATAAGGGPIPDLQDVASQLGLRPMQSKRAWNRLEALISDATIGF